jgi:hypothetical protein
MGPRGARRLNGENAIRPLRTRAPETLDVAREMDRTARSLSLSGSVLETRRVC